MSSERRYPRRLIEVDLPIKEISAHARREKSIRHGHISTLHIWWARRPLAACRAVILAALWPDPADPLCPERFRVEAADVMKDWRNRRGGPQGDWNDPAAVRAALLDFIAEFANWDNSTNTTYMETARRLVQVAHESLGGAAGTLPVVADPFAGGGTIPLEALRVGADAFSSDLNPVAVMLNRIVVTYGSNAITKIRESFLAAAAEVEEWVRGFLAPAFCTSPASTPIAYIWARTAQCEGPGCGVHIPLLRTLRLSKQGKASAWLSLSPSPQSTPPQIEIAVVHQEAATGSGTVKSGSALCPVCDYTTPADAVRTQLSKRRGGSADARLVAVLESTSSGKAFRAPNDSDLRALAHVADLLKELEGQCADIPLIPTEPIPTERPSPNARGLSAVTRVGMQSFGDLYSPRQTLVLAALAHAVRTVSGKLRTGDHAFADAVNVLLAAAVSKRADFGSSLCSWRLGASCVRGTFARQALANTWDFGEMYPFAGSAGDWSEACSFVDKFLTHLAESRLNSGTVVAASATAHPLPDDSVDALVTDPPYYDSVPYADLSDYFYVWLRRSLVGGNALGDAATPKDGEIIWNPTRLVGGRPKDKAFYEEKMTRAFSEGRRITKPHGIGVVVFAHKSTAGWEAVLEALVQAGWIATGSWPLDTERAGRTNAVGTASLASSVHIVCRPRENPDGSVQSDSVGDWRAVLRELPKRIHDWMPRLAKEGVVGADAIFACLGPALEIFSRYSRVEKASGERVELREYLEQVWAAVAKEAFSLIFFGGDATELEPDARLTAIWFWALHVERNGSNDAHVVVDSESGADDADSRKPTKDFTVNTERTIKKVHGYAMEFDTARKLAQGLGVHLETLAGQGGILEIKGSLATIRRVSDRSSFLFGIQGSLFELGSPATNRRHRGPSLGSQRVKMKPASEREKGLFDIQQVPAMPAEQRTLPGFFPPDSRTVVERLVDGGRTTLDRLHQAMLLFGRGQTALLGPMLAATGMTTQARFWTLAQSLSALYPVGTEEKRWVDGVLARKKGLGFG